MRTNIEQPTSIEETVGDREEVIGGTTFEMGPDQANGYDDLVSFDFAGSPVRTVYRNGAVWFVAADVCGILEIVNNRDAVARLDADERSLLDPGETDNSRIMGLISESGLFALVLTSRKPEARKFRRWVTSDVLPSIRRTGSYSRQSAPDPASEHSDIADIINRCPGIYIVIVNKNERRMQHTNGGEVVTLVTEAMSNMMAGALMRAHGALALKRSAMLVVETDEGFAQNELEAAINHGAKVAERYVATRHRRTAGATIPPVGLPR